MRAQVLGSLALTSREGAVPPPTGRTGSLLRWLLLRPNETHGHDVLVARVWADDPVPPDDEVARERLYVVVSRLRRFLQRDDDEDGVRLVTDPTGYRLEAGRDALDRVAFEEAAARALDGSAGSLAEALARWRGDPYGGFPLSEELRRQRSRLLELHGRLLVLGAPAGGSVATRPSLPRTKFLPPVAPPGSSVPRRRLLPRLGRAGEDPLLVVTAPAGFGKSVLLAQWAEAQAGPVAWVTLEADDADPVRLWTAVERSLTEAGAADAGAPPVDAAPGSARFVEALTERLRREGAPVALVLDDVHRIVDGHDHGHLARLLRSLPEELTVALAARPPLEVPLPRGRGPAPSLGPSDLRFDDEEVAELVRSSATAIDRDRLVEVTEGWPIAVSYLSRTGADLRDYDPSSTALRDYVLDEVQQILPPEVRSFLLHTAHLDRLSAELCDAVTGRTDAGRHLAWLQERQLLVTELGAHTGWFRYHHLVGEVLRWLADTDPSVDVDACRRRAARWYRHASLPEEALGHAIAGRDDATVAAVAGDVLWSSISRKEIDSCRRWLHRLDPEVLLADRAAHDVATLAAGGWLEPEQRAAWLESRRHDGDDDDLLPLMVAGHTAYLEGRARDCVAINEACLARVDAYFDAHPNRPGVREVATATLRTSRMSGRILAGDLHHDDRELTDLAQVARSEVAAMSLWLFGEWSFLAYVEGDTRLASELLAEGVPHLASMDAASTHLGAGRLLVAMSLVQSDSADDPATQRRIVRRLEPMVELFRTLRWDTELIPVLLALHVASYRAGDLAAAEARSKEADVLLSLCSDAPLLAAARARLDMGAAAGGRHQDPEDTRITARERAVLEQLGTTLTYDQIAERLGVSRSTVAGHASAIYRKLGVNTRHGAVRRLRAARGLDR